MGIITKTSHISSKQILNHNGSEGDRITILYTPNNGSEVTVLEYVVDSGKITNFRFELEEMTAT